MSLTDCIASLSRVEALRKELCVVKVSLGLKLNIECVPNVVSLTDRVASLSEVALRKELHVVKVSLGLNKNEYRMCF